MSGSCQGVASRGLCRLELELFVESIAPGTDLVVKMDSGYPNLGQVTLVTPAPGQWVHVSVALADLLANPDRGSGLALASVVNPFVLEPTGTQRAHVRIDDIRLRCAVSASPQPWQVDTACGLRLPGGAAVNPTRSALATP
jgi:hypothetical protein